MSEAYIIDAVRTAIGKKGGALSATHPADLGAGVLTHLLERTEIDPHGVDDVIFGCVDAIGPQAGNIARTSWLAAGLPVEVPGVTVDRQCGSSQQAVHFAAQAVMSGTADLVVAGGVQNMSAIPIASAMTVGQQFGFETPFHGSIGWRRMYGDQEVSQFRGAELIARNWQISRIEMEQWALQSHARARSAIENGRFENEIVPVGDFRVDECPRETSLEKMAALPTLLPDGVVTRGLGEPDLRRSERGPRGVGGCGGPSFLDSASTHSSSERAGRGSHLHAQRADTGHEVRAGQVRFEYRRHRRGGDQRGFRAGGLGVDQGNRRRSRPGECQRRCDCLGHPLGATGTKLFASMLNELERTGGRFGLQTICEGGGTANVTIIERLG